MTQHAELYPPSASSRWLTCTASPEFARQFPEDPSEYAQEGSMLHALSEHCMRQKVSPVDFLDGEFQGYKITQEYIDAVTIYIEEVRNQTNEHTWSGGALERQVTVVPDKVFGTADVILFNPNTLYVTDAKFGQGILVYPDDNPQLMIYALGALNWITQEWGYQPEKVMLSIVQPRTPDPIRRWETTATALRQWEQNVLLPAIHEAENDPTFRPSESACRFCPGRAHCRAIAKEATQSAQTEFAIFAPAETEIAPVEEAHQSIATANNQERIGLSELPKLLTALPIIEIVAKAWKDRAKEYLLKDIEVPGYKLVEGKPRRIWGETEAEVTSALTKLGVAPEDQYEKKLVSPAAAEKLAGKKKFAKEEPRLVLKMVGQPALAPIADRRPPLRKTAEEEFASFAINGPVEEPLTEDPPATTTTEPPATTEEPEKKKRKRESAGPGLVLERPAKKVQKPLSAKAEKRGKVLEWGLKGCTLKQAQKWLGGCTPGNVKNHLRALHEVNGYGFKVHESGKFEVFTN